MPVSNRDIISRAGQWQLFESPTACDGAKNEYANKRPLPGDGYASGKGISTIGTVLCYAGVLVRRRAAQKQRVLYIGVGTTGGRHAD